MVDRITKTESNPYRVQDAADDKNRRNKGQQDQREEKDKFIPGTKLNTSPGLARFASKKEILAKSQENSGRYGALDLKTLGKEEDEEKTQPMLIRFLVLWGILDNHSKPRFLILIAYFLAGFVAISSALLIVRILWR